MHAIRVAIPELAELWRNGAMGPVVPLRMSRVLPTPLPYAGSVIRGYVLVGLRMWDTTPLLPTAARKSLVCIALLTREALAPFLSRGMSNETPPVLFRPFSNSV